MFIIEVVVGGGLVLDCIILKCVSNIPPSPMSVNGKGKHWNQLSIQVQFNTTANYNLNNKHID